MYLYTVPDLGPSISSRAFGRGKTLLMVNFGSGNILKAQQISPEMPRTIMEVLQSHEKRV